MTVRRGFVLLLLAILLPLTVAAIGRNRLQLAANQALIESRLSDRAMGAVRVQRSTLNASTTILGLLAQAPAARAGCRAGLQAVVSGYPAILDLVRIAPDGSVACATMDQAGPPPLPPLPMVGRAAGLVITGLEPASPARLPTITAILPIDKGRGGAIAARIDAGWMQRGLNRRDFGDDAIVQVVDDRGQVRAGSGRQPLRGLDLKAPAGSIAEAVSGDGRRWAYAAAPLFRALDRQYYVVYAAPRLRWHDWVWWQVGLGVVQPLLAILLAALAMWFGTSKLLLRWCRDLQTLARDIARGHYHLRRTNFDAAPAELRDLSDALAQMAAAVEQRDNDLRLAAERQQSLARELHHRVKNNFQIVMSLLSLQAESLPDDNMARALAQTRLRISVIALVHRLLYETGETSVIAADALLGDVCRLLSQTFSHQTNIETHCRFERHHLGLDQAVPVALWLVEAMSNAHHHAFTDDQKGRIDATLDIVGDTVVVCVSDTGMAFDGGEAPVTAGTGLRIINGIGKQLGGDVVVVSTPGTGTMLRLTFPVHVVPLAPD